MSETFFIILAMNRAFDGILIAGYSWAATSTRFAQYRIRTPETYRIPQRRKIINTTLNALLSLTFIGAVFYFAGDALVHGEHAGGLTIFGEVLASLLLYDFMYYFMHRGMHHPKLMKYVHGVHHYVRFPTSSESAFLHPLENIAGLGLLFLAVAILGPVSAVSFLIIFFVHSTANIIVHCNLVLPWGIFKLFNFWAKKHDLHHGKHLNRNYASLFPFWDLMFDTYA